MPRSTIDFFRGEAVSYTHLDVYKRQFQGWCFSFGRRNCFLRQSSQRCLCRCGFRHRLRRFHREGHRLGILLHSQSLSLIHILKTATKIFCGCSTAFGAQPNTQCCPVCTGMPGSLPVLNRQVVDYAVKAGMALNCKIEMCIRDSHCWSLLIMKETRN